MKYNKPAAQPSEQLINHLDSLNLLPALDTLLASDSQWFCFDTLNQDLESEDFKDFVSKLGNIEEWINDPWEVLTVECAE